MTDAEFAVFRASVEDIFTSLYVIDVGSLSPEQRKQHQTALAAAYLAIVRLENKAFAALTANAQAMVPQLAASAQALQGQLAGLKKATQTLQLVSASLNILSSIAQLFA